MDQSSHTKIDWSKVRDQVARESRRLDDPAANFPLARKAQDAQAEGRQAGAGR